MTEFANSNLRPSRRDGADAASAARGPTVDWVDLDIDLPELQPDLPEQRHEPLLGLDDDLGDFDFGGDALVGQDVAAMPEPAPKALPEPASYLPVDPGTGDHADPVALDHAEADMSPKPAPGEVVQKAEQAIAVEPWQRLAEAPAEQEPEPISQPRPDPLPDPLPEPIQKSAVTADSSALDDSTPGETSESPPPEPSLESDIADASAPLTPEARVIEYLHARGKLPPGDLARARKLADDGGDPLRIMLVRLGLVSDRDMAAAMASVLDLSLIQADDYPDEPVAADYLSLRFLKDAHIVPLCDDDDGLEIAVADPIDSYATQAVAMALGQPVRLRVGLSADIDAALERLYEQPAEDVADTDLEADLGNFSEEDIEHLRDLASEAPVIRLVNQIMQRAVELRASDIHIEPFADELKVRYRIDGILKESESPPVRSTAAVISRVKIMSKLNIAERRLPQDGRIPVRIQGRELDLRVSTVPTMFGESVVMRLLDKESVSFDFDALGFDGPPSERVLQVLEQPFGIFLVTGPTGSGKSTTLYTALSRLNTEDRKIITVEDPVEYQVPGINQIPVKASIGMSFAHALRAIVRQDPDIIMVGEMRDVETARIAVQSALTGHVVLSTLHTNDAASGVTRLLDMGVEDYLLTSTINGILAQRLVRRLCPECRQPYEPLPEMAARFLHLPMVDDQALTLYHPGGCKACNGTGYRGRLVIAEVLLMSDQIRQAVLSHATATEIQRIAVDQDMLTMYQDGLRKVADGRTTIEEVLRVASDQ